MYVHDFDGEVRMEFTPDDDQEPIIFEPVSVILTWEDDPKVMKYTDSVLAHFGIKIPWWKRLWWRLTAWTRKA